MFIIRSLHIFHHNLLFSVILLIHVMITILVFLMVLISLARISISYGAGICGSDLCRYLALILVALLCRILLRLLLTGAGPCCRFVGFIRFMILCSLCIVPFRLLQTTFWRVHARIWKVPKTYGHAQQP